MRNSCVYISSAHRALVAVFFLAIAAPFACATPLTAGQLTDLMVENQGDNAEFIAIVFGTDANSPLAFTSNVNSAGTLFTFSLTPTLYRGQSMTLTGTGSYDSQPTSCSSLRPVRSAPLPGQRQERQPLRSPEVTLMSSPTSTFSTVESRSRLMSTPKAS